MENIANGKDLKKMPINNENNMRNNPPNAYLYLFFNSMFEKTKYTKTNVDPII